MQTVKSMILLVPKLNSKLVDSQVIPQFARLKVRGARLSAA